MPQIGVNSLGFQAGIAGVRKDNSAELVVMCFHLLRDKSIQRTPPSGEFAAQIFHRRFSYKRIGN
jgi:hypothetical protein